MKAQPIDVWNIETFDAPLIRLLEAKAHVIQGYMRADHDIFVAYDNYNGPDRPLLRPDNPYATPFHALQEAMGEEMKSRIVRAFHYTRMTDAEIAILRRQGIHLSTLATLRARLDALVAEGSLSASAANILYNASPFHRDPLESRPNKFWMASHPIAIDDTGVKTLMSRWGGEVSSMWMRDPDLLTQLASIGTARILELAVPLSATNHCYAAGKAVIATFGRSRGCIPDKHAFDLYAFKPLPPQVLLQIHTEGEQSFTNMGQSYPVGYVDVSIGRWKELTGEDY